MNFPPIRKCASFLSSELDHGLSSEGKVHSARREILEHVFRQDFHINAQQAGSSKRLIPRLYPPPRCPDIVYFGLGR